MSIIAHKKINIKKAASSYAHCKCYYTIISSRMEGEPASATLSCCKNSYSAEEGKND